MDLTPPDELIAVAELARGLGLEKLAPAARPAEAAGQVDSAVWRALTESGLVVGLLLGVLIVLAREVLDKTLRSAARAEAHFRYPVLAEIPARPPTEAATGTICRPPAGASRAPCT